MQSGRFGGLAEDGMGEKKQKDKYVCWLSEQERVLSFHKEEGYEQKEFKNEDEFRKFILAVSHIYKVQ